MRSLFHHWRRTAGCLFLILAVGMTGAWISSLRNCETVEIAVRGTLHRIVSKDGTIQWYRYRGPSPGASQNLKMNWVSGPEYTPSWILSASIEHHPDDLGWHGFAFSKHRGGSPYRSRQDSLVVWMVPYWSIVIPFTLLTGYLILAKPWKRPSGTEEGSKSLGEIACVRPKDANSAL